MKTELGKQGCTVFVPQFPSPPIVPAKLDEWFAVLKDYEKHLHQNTVVIGHSLGGKFLLRILEKRDVSILGAYFVGTPIGVLPIQNNERDNAFTGNDFDWTTIRNNAQYFGVFQSDDDPYVCLENGEQLAKHLGVALSFVPNAGHFNTRAGYTQFPALRDMILHTL